MGARTVDANEDQGVEVSDAEIFAEATAEALGKSGDELLAEADAEPAEEPEAEPAKAGEGKLEEGKEPARDETGKFAKAETQTERGIPSGRLREESDKRRQAEAEAAEKDQRLTALQREFEALKAGLTQRPQAQAQQQQKVDVPDMFADPEGYTRHVIEQANQLANMRLVEGSLADAADTHGDKFKAAYEELQNIGRSEKQQFSTSATVSRIWNSPNPGKALMNWHQQQATLREVGNDPAAYKEKLRTDLLKDPEFLASAIEAAKALARQGDNGRSRSTTRLPPSLNSQTGGSHQVSDPEMDDGSEASVFDYATK